MKNMHDNEVISYEFNLRKKELTLHTLNKSRKKYYNLIFSDVLIHSFKDEYYGSVILDIVRHSIDEFMQDYSSNLELYLKNTFQLTDFLEDINLLLRNADYSYYTISASYGFCGFVIANNLKIINPNGDGGMYEVD